MNEFLHKYQLFNISEFLLEIILVFIFKINFSTPFDPRAVQNTDLHSNSNISKTLRVNIDFKKKTTTFFKRVFDKLSNDIQLDRLRTCNSRVIDI